MPLPPVPRRRSLAEGPSRRGLPAAAPRPKKTGLVLAFALGAVLAGGVAVVAVSLGGSPPPEPPPPVVKKPEPPAPKPPPAPVPAPAPPAPPVRKPAFLPPPPPAAAPDGSAEFRGRLAFKREAALKKVEKARATLAEERRDSEEAARVRRERFARKPLTITLRAGETLREAVIHEFTFHDAEFRAGGAIRRIPWDSVAPASILAAADSLFDPENCAAQYERGKFLVARRLWKEAGQAFEKSVQLGAEFENEVAGLRELIDRVSSGQGFFHGQARRTAQDRLTLTYDLRDEGQLRDFSPGLAWKEGAAVLEVARDEGKVYLLGGERDHPVMFEEELGVEAKLVPETPRLSLHLASERGGWQIDLDGTGTTLLRLPPREEEARKAKPRTVARSATAKLVPGKPLHLRLNLRARRFILQVNGAEALAAEDPLASNDEPRHHVVFGLKMGTGKLRIEGPLTIEGRMRKEDLEKRVGELEVLLRRAVDEDLARLARKREDAIAYALLETNTTVTFTADDPYFVFRIRNNEDLTIYETLKRELMSFLSGRRGDGFDLEEGSRKLDGLIAKYPDVPTLYYLRALVRQERQEHGRAHEDVARALELFPDFPEALLLDSDRRLREYDLAGARRSADRALEVRPDFSPAYVQRAQVRFIQSPMDVAAFQGDLDLALELDPANDEAASQRRVLRIESRGPRDLGCRFEHETEHYRIVTDISDEAARKYGRLLEGAFAFYVELMKPFYKPGRFPKPRVAIFNTAENYYTYFELISEDRGEYTLGVFRPNLNELVLFESLDYEESIHVLYHEAFHHFTTLLTHDTPPFWWNEGMAEYAGGIEVRDGTVARKGLLQVARLRFLKFVLGVGQTLSFEKIMTSTPREFYGPNSMLNYAQGWAMCHFLYEHEGGKHRPMIERYFAALLAKKTPRDAFDEVFKGTVADLEKEWKEYVGKLNPDK